MTSGTADDPVAYARERLHDKPAAIALLDEVERGRARRRQQGAERQQGHPATQPDLAALPAVESRPGPPEAGYTWCIACQSMVPYADWPSHVAHSQAALNHQEHGPDRLP